MNIRKRGLSSRPVRAAVVCACAIVFSIAAIAQNDVGSIVGFIKDQSGAVVPNARITITNENTGESRAATGWMSLQS